MQISGVAIADTFAEAFAMWAARVVITGRDHAWAREAALKMTGMATSVIGCGVEAGIEGELAPEETPDGRCGTAVLLFAPGRAAMGKHLVDRVGQCVLTCPSTACFDGLPTGEEQVRVGGVLRFFGDGFQSAKRLGGTRYCRIPVMDGEFLVADSFHVTPAVGGGNFLILAGNEEDGLAAAARAVAAIGRQRSVILPFPGGVVRSGSKIGSRYKGVAASTNDAYCPTLRRRTATRLPGDVNAVYEVVIDGLTLEAVARATRVGIEAACGPGVREITAGNYGGKLGKYQIPLQPLLKGELAWA